MEASTARAIMARPKPPSFALRRVATTDVSEEAAALFGSLLNNPAFLDGKKRVEFAAMHTFLVLNEFDSKVSSAGAYEFMVKTMDAGKFRFALLHEWISRRSVPLAG